MGQRAEMSPVPRVYPPISFQRKICTKDSKPEAMRAAEIMYCLARKDLGPETPGGLDLQSSSSGLKKQASPHNFKHLAV